jgi:hypothetical protein
VSEARPPRAGLLFGRSAEGDRLELVPKRPINAALGFSERFAFREGWRLETSAGQGWISRAAWDEPRRATQCARADLNFRDIPTQPFLSRVRKGWR